MHTLQSLKTAGTSGPHTWHEKHEFRTALARHMASTGVVHWIVDPFAMAPVMLEHNDLNRPLSHTLRNRFRRDMENGRWIFNHQTLIFSSTRLLDGQHRLDACAGAKTPFEALISFGAPDEIFPFIDAGKARSSSDVFSTHGVVNAKLCSSCARFLWWYDESAVYTRPHISSAMLYDYYAQLPDIELSKPFGQIFHRGGILPVAIGMALHYLCSRQDKHQADTFFTQLADGIGIYSHHDPVYVARTKLLKISGQRAFTTPAEKAAYVIKAWNAMREGKTLRRLHYWPDTPFPTVV